jgi:predicted small metal-binding protein
MQESPQSQWQVTCQCGWRTAGDRTAVVRAVQDHGRTAHNVELTEEQVMAQAVTTGASPA